MHMADALLSPAVGSAMWVTTAGTIAYCSAKVKRELDDRKIPLMGVLGAFIFAAQMINFTIPGTGSSGHLGGGMILAILLGPHAALLVMGSVLMVQALFFADGGLLALGCNIVNLGIFPCFIAYPLIYKPLAGARPGVVRLWLGAVLAAVVGLQLGAFGVVLETLASGVSALSFVTFTLLMQPIHLAIGLVEGVVTAAVVSFIWSARPEILAAAAEGKVVGRATFRPVLIGLLLTALVLAGGLSWFASTRPDGLEWATLKAADNKELAVPDQKLYRSLASIQKKIALLPDYHFSSAATGEKSNNNSDSIIDPGTSVSGVVGGLVTLMIAAGIGFMLRSRQKKKL